MKHYDIIFVYLTCECLYSNSEFDGMLLDYSWQCATLDTMGKLIKLAEVGLLNRLLVLHEDRER